MSIEPNEEIGRAIAAARERAGMNQAQFSAALQAAGLAWYQATVSKVERGERPVRLAEVPMIAEVLQVEPSELIPGAGGLDSTRRGLTQHLRTLEVEALIKVERYLEAAAGLDVLDMLEALAGNRAAAFDVSMTVSDFADWIELRMGAFGGVHRRTGDGWPWVSQLMDPAFKVRAMDLVDYSKVTDQPADVPEWTADDARAEAFRRAFVEQVETVYPNLTFGAVVSDPDDAWIAALRQAVATAEHGQLPPQVRGPLE
ncbi:helix-turn-helix transcriptional regulator [Micrococcus luteus]|nr:helix-turn-helix transcriptional regulator [Micrococcus luteus]MCV7721690.1 helix-turn-helix transcriptional regulator [Micrococcus luteus]